MKVAQTIQLFKEINEGLLTAKLSIGNKAQLIKLAEDLQKTVKIFEEEQKSLIEELGIKIDSKGALTDENSLETKQNFIIKYNELLEQEVPFNKEDYKFDVESISKVETDTVPITFINLFIN